MEDTCIRGGVLHTPFLNAIQGANIAPLRTTSQTIGAVVRGFKSAVSKQIGFRFGNTIITNILFARKNHIRPFRNISSTILQNGAKTNFMLINKIKARDCRHAEWFYCSCSIFSFTSNIFFSISLHEYFFFSVLMLSRIINSRWLA